MRNKKIHFLAKDRGFTLVELMIALALGLLVVGAASIIFLQSKRNYLQNEQVSRVQENGRYALKTLVRDISLAGFLGEHLPRTLIEIDDDLPSINNECGPAGWYTDLDPVFQVEDGVTGTPLTTFDCLSAPDHLAGTDVVAIKRVADAYNLRTVVDVATQCNIDDQCCGTSAPTGCAVSNSKIYLQTNKTGGLIYDLPISSTSATNEQPPAPREDWELMSRVYFIRPWSFTVGDNLPSLCRMVLGKPSGNLAMTTECLAEGIEDMQIEVGIDSDAVLPTPNPLPPGFGIVDLYTPSPTPAQMRQAISAKVYLLIRGTRDLGSINNQKSYTLGSKVIPAKNDGYYRRVFSTNVQLRNVANFNAL